MKRIKLILCWIGALAWLWVPGLWVMFQTWASP
jgi:hypothetical protein